MPVGFIKKNFFTMDGHMKVNVIETIQVDVKTNINTKIIVLGSDAVPCGWNFLTYGPNVGRFLPDNMTSTSRITLVGGYRHKNSKAYRKIVRVLN
jgi:hypothetical protein